MNRFTFLLAALVLFAGSAPAAPPATFVAHYEVLRSGKPIGEAGMSLSAHGDAWAFVTDTRGTSGLAGLLGVDSRESSLFRWRDGMPEMLHYEFSLASGLKNASRSIRVDWPRNSVHVDDSRKGDSHYAAQAGLVERHLLALALAQALRDGKRDILLPVAVRNRVQPERFRVTATETVQVPAGRFDDALRVERSDRDQGFTAWYAPARYPVPLRLTQGSKMELRLVSYGAGGAAQSGSGQAATAQ